mmetsp:Transcript_8341/g.20733  ORF Transcript_8341/g.20733 Transcript_8341/m.20733 type:complete len:162 (+) Transcript_8341:171-656(+)
MPIPGVPLSDDQLFQAQSIVIPAHLLLMFFPTWKHTPTVTLAAAVVFSLLYVALIFGLPSEQPEGASFSTLDGVVAIFSIRANVFLGWVHYLAFDLMVNRWIIADAHTQKIPHLISAICIPFTFMLGPTGLVLYLALKSGYLVFGIDAGGRKAPGKNRKIK